MKNKKNKSERIFYKVFALRLSEEELKELKERHNESNVSWNRFIKYLLYKTKDIDFSLAKEELEEIRLEEIMKDLPEHGIFSIGKLISKKK